MKIRICGLFIMCALLLLCSACEVSLSYGEFVFSGIEKGIMIDDPKEYLVDSKYRDYLVDQAITIPTIKRIYEDRYVIDFMVYALNPDVKVDICQVSLRNNETEVSIPSHEITIEVKQAGTYFNQYYEGGERYCSIPVEDLNAEDGEKYTLDLLVRIEQANGRRTERYMTYSADVVQYKTIVMP